MSRKSNKKGGAKARLGTEDSAKRSAGAVPDEAQSALTGERKGGAKARLGTEDSAKRSAAATHKTADSYYNTLARLGLGMDNLLSSSAYSTLRVTQNQPLLNALYRNDWIAHRIIDSPAEDMIKNWYQLDTMLSPDYLNQYRKEERRTNVKSKLLSGVKWARLYGGAAGLMMLRNQENLLDQPLDAAAIMPGDFRGIQVVDRWNGVSPSLELVEDPDDDEFGMPAFYNFTLATGSTLRVHHSRVLRFPGREMPYAEQQAENWWGTSELEHVFEEINKRNATSANIAQLVFRANLMVYKKDDMDAFLTSTNERAQQDLYRVLRAQNQLMSNMGLQVINKQDDFQNFQYTFSGISDVYELFMLDVSGAAEIPVTRLFGRSPAGLNATGESDMQNYYDTIQQKQETMLRPVLNKLIPILCMSAWGEIPDDLDFSFLPIRTPDDLELAELAEKKAAIVTSVFASGAISQRTALRELRKIGEETGVFATLTDDDVNRADDTTGLSPAEFEPLNLK